METEEARDRREIRLLFMKTLFESFTKASNLPQTILLLLAIIGVSGKIPDIAIPQWAWLCFFALVVLWTAMATTVNVVMEDRRKAAISFYSHSEGARLDRAHHILCKRLSMAQEYQFAWTLQQKQQWDRMLIKEITELCKPWCIQEYLTNTGRHTTMVPIDYLYFDRAIKYVKEYLMGSILLHRLKD